MIVLAIDPGNTESALVLYDADARVVLGHAKHDNETALVDLRSRTAELRDAHLAIEMIASYGMAVGAEVFETCVWIGRFVQAWWPRPWTKVYRREVKAEVCGDSRAKDANIRQALIDRFGPGKERAIGTKRSPGPLYGISADQWSALAVAVTFAAQRAARSAA